MTVSENNIQTVSQGDAVLLQAETIQEDFSDVAIQLENLNYTALALLFFIIFSWVENRLRSAVRKVMKNGEFN